MTIHPAAEIFPLMKVAEFEALVKDINEYGQKEPCLTWNGELLDGRNRWRACERLGIKPKVVVISDPDFDPVAFVLSKNLHRRHLDASQRAMIAARVAEV